MLKVFRNEEEVIVCEVDKEGNAADESLYFGEENRNMDDYDVELVNSKSVSVKSSLKVN